MHPQVTRSWAWRGEYCHRPVISCQLATAASLRCLSERMSYDNNDQAGDDRKRAKESYVIEQVPLPAIGEKVPVNPQYYVYRFSALGRSHQRQGNPAESCVIRPMILRGPHLDQWY